MKKIFTLISLFAITLAANAQLSFVYNDAPVANGATIVSDNENVVSVDKNGVITAVAPGVANIKEELEINMEMLPGIKQNVVKISATAKIKVVE